MRKSALISYLAASLLATHAAQAPADEYLAHDWHHLSAFLKNSTIEGAWEVVVTLRVAAPDCTTAAVVPTGVNPFLSLNTFHEGGTMSEWGTRAPPATRTSGHGVWRRTSYSTFVYRELFHSFDPNGLLTAKMDISTGLKLAADGLTFTGVSRFVRTDLSGNVLNFCATMAGTRITV